MSLLLSGVQRVKALVLLSVAALLAASTLLGASPASATAGVTVAPGTATCYSLERHVTNNSDQTVLVQEYFVNNGVFFQPAYPLELAPGDSFTMQTDKKYFTQEYGIKTMYGSYATGARSTEWTDWGATTYVHPAECPMIAPAKLTSRTKAVFTTSQPKIWFKTKAFMTDFGYKVGNSSKIKWPSKLQFAGLHAANGPRMKPGQRLKITFYSLNRDSTNERTAPVVVGKKWFKRVR